MTRYKTKLNVHFKSSDIHIMPQIELILEYHIALYYFKFSTQIKTKLTMVSLQSVHTSVSGGSSLHKPKLRSCKSVQQMAVKRDDPDLLTRTSWTNAVVALSQIKKVRACSIYNCTQEFSGRPHWAKTPKRPRKT